MFLNSPTIGPAGDLVDVSYTGYPDCKGSKLRPSLTEEFYQRQPQL